MIYQLDNFLDVTSQTIKCCLVTSFGPTSLIILDRIAQSEELRQRIPIITIDTGFLFDQTIELKHQIELKYHLQIQVIKAHSPYGPDERKFCCHTRKVLPLQNILRGYGAWYTGIRQDQNENRSHMKQIIRDDKNGLIKINPLFYWTNSMVWSFIVANNLPYNQLHNMGYDSIGCSPCTIPGKGREGRLLGEKKECGLHL